MGYIRAPCPKFHFLNKRAQKNTLPTPKKAKPTGFVWFFRKKPPKKTMKYQSKNYKPEKMGLRVILQNNSPQWKTKIGGEPHNVLGDLTTNPFFLLKKTFSKKELIYRFWKNEKIFFFCRRSLKKLVFPKPWLFMRSKYVYRCLGYT